MILQKQSESTNLVEKDAERCKLTWGGGEITQHKKTLHPSCENPNDGPEIIILLLWVFFNGSFLEPKNFKR